MKVILRNPFASDGRDFRHSLTVGSEYEVLGIEAGDYRLFNDRAEPVLYEPPCFEVVDANEPPFWTTELGDEGERYAYPPGWSVPGFFEAWHDRDAVIREVFSGQLAYWYPTVRQPE